jgi:HEAT repeat protein
VTESSFPPLSGRFGLERLVSALSAANPEERRVAIQRLAGLGTPAALQRLVNVALERRAQLEPREWLSLVRVLAPHASEGEPRRLLALAMNQRPSDSGGPAQVALLELVRGTAALALAASGSEPALRVLGAALRGGGPAAALAADALLEYPPADLSLLLSVPGEPSVELARWLGALGDQRAFHTLRGWVRGESAEVRAAAAIALTQLGALETVPLARAWLRSGVPVLQHAAGEIAMLTQQPEAVAFLLEELRTTPRDAALLSRVLEFPQPELVPWASASAASARWTLLGRIGDRAAIAQLESALGSAEGAFAAAQALSRVPDVEARATLERALVARHALPLVVRAAALREQLWPDDFALLPERLAQLHTSKLPAERAAGAWASSLRSATAALTELESKDVVRTEAAANNALRFDDRVLVAAAGRLSQAEPGRARSAFAFALLRPSGARAVTSELLESLVLEGGVAAPLALRALAARAEPRFVALADTYLAHPDPLLRAHVARGLGESQRSTAVGLLMRSFEFETDEIVRQAIVRALSSHQGPRARETLELAARLDASARVRAAAQLALGGVELRDPPPGDEAMWAQLPAQPSPPREQAVAAQPHQIAAAQPHQTVAAQPHQAVAAQPHQTVAATSGAVGLLHVLPGLALPVFADTAGILVVAGVSQPLALRWQSSPER